MIFSDKRINQDITGNYEDIEYKTMTYVLGKYEITVRLSLTNEFIGIEQIKVNRDFIDYEKKLTPEGYHDVDEFYTK